MNKNVCQKNGTAWSTGIGQQWSLEKGKPRRQTPFLLLFQNREPQAIYSKCYDPFGRAVLTYTLEKWPGIHWEEGSLANCSYRSHLSSAVGATGACRRGFSAAMWGGIHRSLSFLLLCQIRIHGGRKFQVFSPFIYLFIFIREHYVVIVSIQEGAFFFVLGGTESHTHGIPYHVHSDESWVLLSEEARVCVCVCILNTWPLRKNCNKRHPGGSLVV